MVLRVILYPNLNKTLFMKSHIKIFTLLAGVFLMISCGDSEKKEKEEVKTGDYSQEAPKKEAAATSSKDMVDMSNKGIGPIKSVTLNAEIDQALAVKGETVFKNMCTACHKTNKKFIGPALVGITERRSPEWIMNMILNPEEMIAKDPIAKQLLLESNMAVMANQNLTEEEARSILEYFRTLKEEI
ncbi:cytochrome c [Gillisia limnaea]|uniref:Cytochrome c class I n=2 Tax=Gillisia TaxID=244698 RepID=H2BXZ8_GILLR|nr:cytochrome c class I [Gillisia limnaea DSM 15749]